MSPLDSAAARLLGARIRNERQRFALSQMDLADLASLHFTNLGRIERGQANPNLDTIVRIASALELDPGVLLQGMTADMLPERTHGVTAGDLIRAREAQPAPRRTA